MPASTKIPPIHKSIRVAVPAKRAFEVFTANMHRWWPAEHSLLKAPRASPDGWGAGLASFAAAAEAAS
jgi:hypothetical protein